MPVTLLALFSVMPVAAALMVAAPVGLSANAPPPVELPPELIAALWL
ncbi:hypothetical protein RSW36_25810 [Escherichia coli]|nr:hypothetical protein [Escherichia coli]